MGGIMANKQTLPNGMLDANVGAITSQGANKVVAPEWQDTKWSTISKIGKGIVGVAESFKNLKQTEMFAKLENVQQQNLHELSEASDPSQVQGMIDNFNKGYDELFKDDYYGKSFYQSEAYKAFKIKNEASVQKVRNGLDTKFETIQAVKAGNEISSDIALMSDPAQMSRAFDAFRNNVNNATHIPADKKFEIISSVAKDSFGKSLANNPNNAIAWYNASQGAYDQYGVDGADLKNKADRYYRGLASEKRAAENYEHTKQTRLREAKTNQYKATIIQFPDQADAILAKAMVEDNKMYVDLVKFVEDRTPKSTKRSALSKEAVKVYAEKGLEGLKEHIENNPETLNDPNTMNFFENAKKINKEDDSTLEEMEKAFEEGRYPEYREKHLPRILAKSETRTADEAYRKSLNVSGNADSYTLRIANADSVDEVNSIASEAFDDKDLTDKEKANVAKYKNTRINQIETKETKAENRAEKVANKEEKARKEARKEASKRAYGEILGEELNGSKAIAQKTLQNSDLLEVDELNKAISLYNKTAKAESNEAKDLLKEVQSENYNKLMQKFRDGTLTQEDIDNAYENKHISAKQKENLENTIYKKDIADTKQAKADAKEEALKIVYTADANGETVDVGALPSSDSDVLKAANQVNLKNAKNKYYEAENEVFAELLANPNPTNEQLDELTNKLIENDYMGNTKSPDEFIADSLNKIRGLEEKEIRSAKNKIDTMFGYPLRGSKFSDYEIEQKNLAYQDAITALVDDKTPNYDEIIKRRKPTMEGFNAYYKNKDNAYYSLLSTRDGLFLTKEVKEEKGGVVTKSKSYTLNPTYKFSDFNAYVDDLNKNRQNLSDSNYKELYKPVALYLGDILKTAKKDDSIQAYALNQLRDFIYGKGNPIDNPVSFYEEYRKIMAVVEEKVADRNNPADPWGWNNYKSAIDNVIFDYMQNGQQLTGYKGR